MSLKDLHDISNRVSEKQRQEGLRHDSERKDEYDSLADEISERKKQKNEDVINSSKGNILKRNAGIIKILLLIAILCLTAFQLYRGFGTKVKKTGFDPYKPSYVLVENDTAGSLKQFLDKALASYAKDGEKGIAGLWDEKLPPYVITSSTKKLASKDIKGISFKKAVMERNLSSYSVYYSGENKSGLLLRVYMKNDGTFRLTGIE